MVHLFSSGGSSPPFDRYVRFLFLASGSLIAVTLLSSLAYGRTYDPLARGFSFFSLSGIPQSSVPIFWGCFILLGLFLLFLGQPLYSGRRR